MITKDNIAEVLKHNNLKFKLYRNCIQLNNDDSDNTTVIDLDHVNLILIIEAHYGRKLEPLPEHNPFDVVKVGQWVRCISSNEWDGNTITSGKWYQCTFPSHTLVKKCFWFVGDDKKSHYSSKESQWDLTDICDYNPDECQLKIGDKISFENGVEYQKFNR